MQSIYILFFMSKVQALEDYSMDFGLIKLLRRGDNVFLFKKKFIKQKTLPLFLKPLNFFFNNF